MLNKTNTFPDYCLVREEILMNIKLNIYLIVIKYSEGKGNVCINFLKLERASQVQEAP